MTDPNWVVPFAEAWAETLKGEPPYGQIGKHFKALVQKVGAERLYAPWRHYLAQSGVYASPARFVATWGQYEAPAVIPEAVHGPLVEDGWLTIEGDILTRPRS